MAPHEELKIKYQTGWMGSVTKKPVATEMLREAFRTVMMTGEREPAGLFLNGSLTINGATADRLESLPMMSG